MAIVFLLSFELLFYLLIVQTGIVEFYNSNIFTLALIPIGGVLGSLFTVFMQKQIENKLSFFLLLQLFISFFYPNLSQVMLFILGFSSGVISVLMIDELKKANRVSLGLGLSLSYVIGTLLFNTAVDERRVYAVLFTFIALVASRLLLLEKEKFAVTSEHSLWAMSLWVLLDSALFESLSRDNSFSIWRDGYSFEIAFFHVVGVVLALTLNFSQRGKELFIAITFLLSYILYFLNQADILAAIYPIAISYYNIAILQTVLKKPLRTIGIYMIFIAWMASGIGLFSALNGALEYLFAIFIFLFYIILKGEKK
jgi:hypothetical protein